MSLINALVLNSSIDSINLTITNHLSERDNSIPKWKFLNRELEDIGPTPIHKAVWCIINSILYQERVCFTLTRDSLRKMIKNDQNLSFGLKNDNYSKIVKVLTTGKEPLLKQIAKGEKAYAYEVISPILLKLLVVDVNEQRKQTIDFANGLLIDEVIDNNDCTINDGDI